MSGVLYLVGTPIGNLDDFSPRAAESLRQADLILAEDTRHSAKLLRHFGIQTPCRAWHAHNENQAQHAVLEQLQAGKKLALISDAGMPLIADPGFPLVRAARQAGVAVECVPGPTALISALVLSGLPSERFMFEAFLPAKSAARKTRMQAWLQEERTVVFYESPHRLAASLADAVEVLGPTRDCVLARELTKRYESVYSGSLAEMASWAAGDGEDRRGEFVVVLAGVEAAQESDAIDREHLLRCLLSEMPTKPAAKMAAKILGGKTNQYYQLALSLADES